MCARRLAESIVESELFTESDGKNSLIEEIVELTFRQIETSEQAREESTPTRLALRCDPATPYICS